MEIHQINLASSDVTFALELDASVLITEQPHLGVDLSGSQFSLNWSALDPGVFALYAATNLKPPIAWQRLTNPPSLVTGVWQITLPHTNSNRFFRLQTQ